MAVATKKNKLLKRNIDSRDTMESISTWLLSLWALIIKEPKAMPMIVVTKMRMYNPRSGSVANVWTEVRTPLRTRKVPIKESENVTIMRNRFQTLNIFRFSWTITEWRKAVPTSQGINDAFSTGSHPQYPPQPSS